MTLEELVAAIPAGWRLSTLADTLANTGTGSWAVTLTRDNKTPLAIAYAHTPTAALLDAIEKAKTL